MHPIPLLAKLAVVRQADSRAGKPCYDTTTETAVVAPEWTADILGATGSLMTFANTDPTHDEPTDR